MCIRTIIGGRYQNAFRSSLMLNRPIEIPDRGNINSTSISLCLNYDLASTDWIRIKCNSIYTPITT